MERSCQLHINPETKLKITEDEKINITHCIPFEKMQQQVHNIIYGVNLIQSLDLTLNLQNINDIEQQIKTHQKKWFRQIPIVEYCPRQRHMCGLGGAML